MVKTKHKLPLLIITIMLVISIILNVILLINYNTTNNNDILEIDNTGKIEGTFDSNIKYYTEIVPKKFKKVITQDRTITIAVVDNTSLTHDKFVELINKISFYKNSNIYLLEISKLSKKNEIYFYELDDRLKELESDYIITLNNEKVISITEFDSEDINIILENLK